MLISRNEFISRFYSVQFVSKLPVDVQNHKVGSRMELVLFVSFHACETEGQVTFFVVV